MPGTKEARLSHGEIQLLPSEVLSALRAQNRAGRVDIDWEDDGCYLQNLRADYVCKAGREMGSVSASWF